ncbi:DUF1764-domain-containing protein [Panus rudis PR-1116 ss-1]|nr:DUF1764-domain-containing protein [Panus rudis PR-1116 ss-1]
MPASEIDDIFAAKGKPKPASPPPADSVKKKKKKKNKRKRDEADEQTAGEDKQPAKRKVPETVVDPSTRLAPPSKPSKSTARPEKQQKSKAQREEEDRFKDSRGTGPRRTTEEGFLIYKEDELGISREGGDTPLCPFDCQCCKFFPSQVPP